MKRLLIGTLLALILTDSVAIAQDVVVGGIAKVNGSYEVPTPSKTLTVIDLSAGANIAGSLTTATVAFETIGSCIGATFRLRFFRRSIQFGMLQLVAERGPFNPTVGFQTVNLVPPVSVEAGDLIGIAMAGGTSCGLGSSYDNTYDTVEIGSDFTGGSMIGAEEVHTTRIALRAASASPALVGFIPAVGITAGAAGSMFNTSFAVSNVSNVAAMYRFVFHPAGQMGSSSDPASTLTLAAGASSSSNILQTLGVTGIGSMDVYSDGAPPLINARVFNDTGSGTNGFSEPMERLFRSGPPDTLVMNIPSDLSRFRMNVGVRSLQSGATVTCNASDATGRATGSANITYLPNYLDLHAASTFFTNPAGNPSLAPGGSVVCSVKAGDALLFNTVTDNQTNDSAIFVAEKR